MQQPTLTQQKKTQEKIAM